MKVVVKGKEYKLEDLHITGNCSEEREITVATTADEDIIHVYTSDDVYLTKIKKLILTNPKDWILKNIVFGKDNVISGVMVQGPKNGLSLRAALEREYSDEQKAAMAERARAISPFNKQTNK